MVTTRRLSNNVNNSFEQFATANSDVAVLERPITEEKVPEVQAVKAPARDMSEEAAERRKNLDKLLNYDRYSEQMSAAVETLQPIIEEQKVEEPVISLSEEDIRPTSTTMQFGDDIESIREEMRMEKEEEKTEYRLNGKGKLAIVLYSLAVTVILALIVMNTGLISRLDKAIASADVAKASVYSELTAIEQEIGAISDSDYIANIAQNELGMIKGN